VNAASAQRMIILVRPPFVTRRGEEVEPCTVPAAVRGALKPPNKKAAKRRGGVHSGPNQLFGGDT
jgi:hypothetical protein